ncbi:MAG: ParB/RepB/Spo0J family partition protein [Clostridia bacterium]|nr:ParB/RepB/Spo0J family partition protein [Clostridia bacterium]MBQ7788281.1 ParB/RepB/Spo0J family partition protein [Clostridia bacterium]
MKKGLGKGLDSIFADNYIEATASSQEGAQTLRVSEIEPKADQPRKYFDQEALEQLAESIKQHGLLQPIIVRESAGGFYQIIAGERRWRASKLAGLTEVPVIIMQADALKAAEIAIIENIQREDLNPYEEATAYRSLMEQYELTQEEVAEKVGKSRSAVANTMRLLELPEEVIDMLKTGDISAGHARALLGLKNKDEEAVVEVAKDILVRSLSVRDTEMLVKKLNKLFEKATTEPNQPKNDDKLEVDYVKELERKAMTLTGKRVKISANSKVKTLQIEYFDNEDLEEILIKLCGKKIID